MNFQYNFHHRTCSELFMGLYVFVMPSVGSEWYIRRILRVYRWLFCAVFEHEMDNICNGCPRLTDCGSRVRLYSLEGGFDFSWWLRVYTVQAVERNRDNISKVGTVRDIFAKPFARLLQRQGSIMSYSFFSRRSFFFIFISHTELRERIILWWHRKKWTSLIR